MIIESSNKKNYDALIIPTGETTFGDYNFPVTKKALELFDSGKFGCIFITGGYSGFATAERKAGISEGGETYDYIVGNREINPDKVFYDDQSLESVGNFTFPIVKPMINPYTKKNNPNFRDFNKMLVIGKEGHMWRIKDYVKHAMPWKYYKYKMDFHNVEGEHNNGLAAKVYHRGIMHALKDKYGAEEVNDFLINNHPFYSEGWYDKSVNRRKAEMALKGLGWNAGIGGK